MERFKQVLDEHSVTELSNYIFRELSAYHINKLNKAIKKTHKLVDEEDYEDKTVPININKNNSADPFEIGLTAKAVTKDIFDQHLINKAQEIIDFEIGDWEDADCFVKFIINEDSKTVKAIVRDMDTGEIEEKGTAICNKTDKFDPTIGKMIAIYKATYMDWKEMLTKKGFKHLLA